MTSPSPSDAAAWMAEKLKETGTLYQEDAAWGLKREFGDDTVYINREGNLAIQPDVLKAFRKITEPEVVWDRGERAWRYRKSYDPETGRQV